MQVTQDDLCPDPGARRAAARLGAWALWSGVAGLLLVLVPLAFMPALILGHVMRVRFPKAKPAFRRDRRCALMGLVFGYSAAVLQVAAILVTLFWPLCVQRYIRFRYPPNTRILLVLDAAGREVTEEDVFRATVSVSERLQALDIPHAVESLPRNRIVVTVPVNELWSETLFRQLLGRPGWLEFRLVHAENDALIAALFEKGHIPPGYAKAPVMHGGLFRKLPEPPGEAPADLSRFHVPDPAYEFVLHEVVRGSDVFHQPLYIRRRPELTSHDVQGAEINFESMSGPAIDLQFSPKGAKRFAAVTSRHIGRKLAIDTNLIIQLRKGLSPNLRLRP